MATVPRIAVFVALLATSCAGPESPGSKSEWSVLQGVEYSHRSEPLSAPLTIEVSGHRVLGLPRNDKPGSIWILLDPKHVPLYKQLPEGSYSLSKPQLAALQVREPAVLAQLQKHVRDSEP